jgi:hypothetical protein
MVALPHQTSRRLIPLERLPHEIRRIERQQAEAMGTRTSLGGQRQELVARSHLPEQDFTKCIDMKSCSAKQTMMRTDFAWRR